jgi:hypothetical protein
MHAIAISSRRRSLARPAYAALAVALAAAAVAELGAHGTGWWQLAAFVIGPDIAVLLGIGRGLEKGRLHPRAIPLYNALHSLAGPLLLLALGLTGVLSAAWLVGGLAWTFHVTFDRAIGYGKRTRDGHQRA